MDLSSFNQEVNMRRLKLFSFILMAIVLGACSSGNVKKTSSVPENTAYDFELPDQNGKVIKLSSILKKYRGAVIAFYPKDDTKK